MDEKPFDHEIYAKSIKILTFQALLRGVPSERQISSVQLSWAHLKEIGTPIVGEYFCKRPGAVSQLFQAFLPGCTSIMICHYDLYIYIYIFKYILSLVVNAGLKNRL